MNVKYCVTTDCLSLKYDIKKGLPVCLFCYNIPHPIVEFEECPLKKQVNHNVLSDIEVTDEVEKAIIVLNKKGWAVTLTKK